MNPVLEGILAALKAVVIWALICGIPGIIAYNYISYELYHTFQIISSDKGELFTKEFIKSLQIGGGGGILFGALIYSKYYLYS